MPFYETDLEVVEGCFTLGEVLHTDILPHIPIRFQLNVLLKTFHYTCDCQCFYIFSSEDENSHIDFYVDTNEWETIQSVNEDTRELIFLISCYNSLSNRRNIKIQLYDMDKKYPDNLKSITSITLPNETSTISQNFLDRIRVVTKESGNMYTINGITC